MVRLRIGKNRRVARDLETPRFHLRHLGQLAALRLTASWRADPDILMALYMSVRPRSLLKWIATFPTPDNLSRFGWAIVPREQPAAPIGLHMVRRTDYRSVSMMVALSDRNWWGRDVVTEVRARTINHVFAHADIDRIEGTTTSINPASIFNYRRLGFSHVGTRHRVRRHDGDGRVYDTLTFEIFREQWEKTPFYDPYVSDGP